MLVSGHGLQIVVIVQQYGKVSGTKRHDLDRHDLDPPRLLLVPVTSRTASDVESVDANKA